MAAMTAGAVVGAHILVVEDDPDVRVYLSEVLRRSGAVPHPVSDGLSAVQAARSERPNLVLLDLGLPRVDGSALVEVFRYELGVPVIIVSGRRSTGDVVTGLYDGADDYLVKPVRSEELVARVHAVLRRSDARVRASVVATATEVLDHGDLVVDVDAKAVEVDGRSVALTSREFELLVHLARHPNRTFSRREILADVWHSTPATSAASTVNEHVRRLRSKIEIDPSDPRWIVTVKGFGYRFAVAA